MNLACLSAMSSVLERPDILILILIRSGHVAQPAQPATLISDGEGDLFQPPCI
ncbi:hypothetical protein ASPWEDRAFT_449157 [Aspergillus wentii DTO 134E9]|uniref:Uncharacterized protein n=1 Tax=Aspergillus wentii DTO 134E9 TaxID=1073089 RepID=A0A1L9RQX3_ASPWE|nr:uncharacterized protein ASPWEDRAFT_449157 [Aspergillus wentii DTO 134E9]OJJ37331.1 hypothetical protein ASPWEDRAFT_449157 [Aspergillus wentii DTO 134E9]